MVSIQVIALVSSITDEELSELSKQAGEKITREALAKLFPFGYPKGRGSGFIVNTERGLLLITNAHVASAAQASGMELRIKTSDVPYILRGVSREDDTIAEIGAIGRGGGLDLAILKIPPTRKDGKPWGTLELGSSSDIREGDDVWAAGYPLDQGFTVTQGIVSAMNLPMGPYVTFTQTDAAINPGNSGGPLVNSRGRVVAVNTGIASQSGTSSGIGFSISGEDVERALRQYFRTGELGSGFIGLSFRDSTVVMEVVKGGAGEKAGFKTGDKIINVDGKDLPEDGALAVFQLIKTVKSKVPGTDNIPGDTVEFTVKRGNEILILKMTVAKEPPANKD